MKNYTCGDRKFEIKVDEVDVAPGLSIEKSEQRQDRTQERGGGCKGNVRGHNGGARTVKEANLPFNVSGSHGKVKAEQDSG